jgi:hypothetical protein
VKTRRPLFEIAHDILRALDQSEGEIDAAMQALDLELEDKVSAYKVVIQRLEADADANETVGKDLRAHYAAKADVARKQVERVKQHLAKGLEVAGVEDVRTSTAHVYYKTTKAIEIDNPDDFCARHLTTLLVKTETRATPNRAEIASLLADGLPVEGAKLVERKHLQVR